ncbi:MAG: hypothetical protein CHACPFDD_02628 [Phycisphaerae bacterium]|nr:hypothetical protein [Phycisphaerae bacterium]
MPPDSSRTTQLLLQLTAGDQRAAAELVPLVYDELRALAANYLRRERPDHTLQPTALINEVYLRLIHAGGVDWKGRAHFLAVAARAMRRILVNHAAARNAEKRGGGAPTLSMSVEPAEPPRSLDLLALDEALQGLAKLDPRKVDVVECRFFGGMSVEETSHVLNVSVSTVEADWRLARAWLSNALATGSDSPP